MAIDASSEFFTITKRIENGVSGAAGDSGPLGPNEQRVSPMPAPEATEGIWAAMEHRYEQPETDFVADALHDDQVSR